MPFASLPTVGVLPRRSDITTRDPDHLRETAADVTRYGTSYCTFVRSWIPFCPSRRVGESAEHAVRHPQVSLEALRAPLLAPPVAPTHYRRSAPQGRLSRSGA